MRLTDWQGNEYGVGDTVIYPVMSGRTVSMQQATVLDIWTAYNCPDDYKWKPLKEGEPVPTKEEWDWKVIVEADGQPRRERVSKGHKPVETQLRVKLQPEGKSSRGYSTRTDEVSHWVDPEGNDIEWRDMYEIILKEHDYDMHDWNIPWNERKHPRDFGYDIRRETVTPKPVTLLICDNITFLHKKKVDGYRCPTCDSDNPLIHVFHTK